MNKKRIGFFIFVLAFLMIPKTVFAAESCSKIGIDKNKWEYSKTIKNAGNEYKDEETSSQKVVCCKKGSGSLEHMECDIYKKKTATNDTDKDKDSNSNSDNSSDNNSDNSSNNQDATSNPLTGVQCKTAGEKVDKNKWKFKKYIYDLNDEYETGDQGTEYYACCKIGQGFIGEGANRKVCDVYELVDPSA